MPIVIEGLVIKSVKEQLQAVGDALYVSQNAAELCALAGGPLDPFWGVSGCHLELRDLGYVLPTVQALPGSRARARAREHEQQMATAVSQQEIDGTDVTMVIRVCAVAAAPFLLFALYRYMKRKTKTTETHEIKLQIKEAPMDVSQPAEEKEPVEQDDDKSTVCPSHFSDQQSENAFSPFGGDIENVESPLPPYTASPPPANDS